MRDINISFVGAGNVASALAQELFRSGFNIRQISSRGESSCRTLALLCNASWSPDLCFTEDTDLIIVSVPDDSLLSVIKKIECAGHTVVVHTAGSTGLEVFPPELEHTGIFYPLQTFTRERYVDFSRIHIFIETEDLFTSTLLINIAEALKSRYHFSGTENRRLLHVAAVFVNNFTNFMFHSGKIIAERAGFDFEVLKPLIEETVSKAFALGPENSQTGPAARADKGTIENHIKLLSSSPDLQRVYAEISKSIAGLNKRQNE